MSRWRKELPKSQGQGLINRLQEISGQKSIKTLLQYWTFEKPQLVVTIQIFKCLSQLGNLTFTGKTHKKWNSRQNGHHISPMKQIVSGCFLVMFENLHSLWKIFSHDASDNDISTIFYLWATDLCSIQCWFLVVFPWELPKILIDALANSNGHNTIVQE